MKLRVFVSSTYEDLKEHRKVIRDAILKIPWDLEMMEYFNTETGATVEECLKKLRQADLVILVVAFKRGWVPLPDKGGRDGKSITALELEEARRLGKPVRVLLATGNWPGSLWEHDAEAFLAVNRFRDELNQIAAKFDVDHPNPDGGEPRPGPRFHGIVHQLLNDHRESLLSQMPAAPVAATLAGLEPLLPELWPALNGVLLSQQGLLRAYQEFAPPAWNPPPQNASPSVLLSWCVQQLAAAPARHDGRVPLLDFLNTCKRELPDAQSRPIANWIERAAAHLGIRVETMPARPAAAVPCVALMIQIERARTSDGSYLLKAWLSGTKDLPTLRPGDTPLSLEALRQEVRQLCGEVEQLRPVGAELLVEFLLPGGMAGLDPEWWEVEDELSCPVPLATRHRVVVRPLDRHRARAADIKQAWLKRWTELESKKEILCHVGCTLPPDPPTCHAVRHEKPEGGPFRSLLALAPSVVCVILGRPLSGAVTDKDLLGPVLSAGIPAALWVRGNPDGLASLIDELRKTKMGDLPELVLRLRCEAHGHGDPSHIGWHLTLLWDDVHRLSPELDRDKSNPLTNPARLSAP